MTTRNIHFGIHEGIIRKLVRLGHSPLSISSFKVLCNTTESSLFACILNNSCHVLHNLLPLIKITRYFMRTRSHNRELPMFDICLGNAF